MCRRWIDWDEVYRIEREEEESRAKARKDLDKAVRQKYGPSARSSIVYYPLYRKYSACMFINDKYYELTPEYFTTIEICSQQAIKNLEKLEINHECK